MRRSHRIAVYANAALATTGAENDFGVRRRSSSLLAADRYRCPISGVDLSSGTASNLKHTVLATYGVVRRIHAAEAYLFRSPQTRLAFKNGECK